MQSACFLGHPLVAYYIIQICPEKNIGLNFKGDEEVDEQRPPSPRRPLTAPPPSPLLKPLRFSCGSTSRDLHMSCISRICIARFRFALDLSLSPPLGNPPVMPLSRTFAGFSAGRIFAHSAIYAGLAFVRLLHIRPVRVDLPNN